MTATDFRIGERSWRYSLAPAIGAGARSKGDAPPVAESPGIFFTADNGETRIAEVPEASGMTEDSLRDVPLDQVIRWFKESELVTLGRKN
jgi:hypothetical protein